LKEEVETESDFEENTNLSELTKRGGDYMCNVSHQTQVGTSNGTVYITGPKIRGDFTSSVEVPGLVSMDVTSHMISDGEFIHTWTSLSNEGYKNAVSSKTEA